MAVKRARDSDPLAADFARLRSVVPAGCLRHPTRTGSCSGCRPTIWAAPARNHNRDVTRFVTDEQVTRLSQRDRACCDMNDKTAEKIGRNSHFITPPHFINYDEIVELVGDILRFNAVSPF